MNDIKFWFFIGLTFGIALGLFISQVIEMVVIYLHESRQEESEITSLLNQQKRGG